MAKDSDGQKKARKEVIVSAADAVVGAIISVSPFGTIKAGLDWYSKKKEHQFQEKLIQFFAETDHFTKEETEAFSKKIDQNREDFYYKLFDIIEQLDEKEKVEIVSKLFKGMIKDKVKVKEFFRLSSIIRQLFIDDLQFFRKNAGNLGAVVKHLSLGIQGKSESSTLKLLTSVGLLEEIPRVTTQSGTSPVNYDYQLTDIGLILKDYSSFL